MSPQWIPQNIQKRLLLYVLQQLSLFSEIDLPNLEEVSLNNIILKDVQIDPEKVGKLHGFNMRYGQVGQLELSGGVMGGVNVEVSNVDIVIAPNFDTANERKDNVQFSIAQSTADLANTIMLNKDEAIGNKELPQSESEDDEDEDDNLAKDDTARDSPKSKPPSSSASTSGSKSSALSGVMARAVEVALSRLQIKINNISIKIVSELTDLRVSIEEISLKTVNGTRNFKVSGLKVVTLNPEVNPGESSSGVKNENSSTERTKASSVPNSVPTSEDEDDDNGYGDESLMDSMVFTHEEASSIYMSATSQSFKRDGESSQNEQDSLTPVVLYIDECFVTFEGLSDIANLVVQVNELKVAAVPAFPTVISIFTSITRGLKLKNYQKKKENFNLRKTSRFPQYEADDNPSSASSHSSGSSSTSEDNDGDATNELLFSKLHIKEVLVSLTSAILPTGELASPDSNTSVSLKNLHVKQKNEDLVYGGIEQFKIAQVIDGIKQNILSFSEDHAQPREDQVDAEKPEPSTSTGSMTKADFRFEYFKKSDSSEIEFTTLCSKVCAIDVTKESIPILLNFSTSLNSVLNHFNLLKVSLKALHELDQPVSVAGGRKPVEQESSAAAFRLIFQSALINIRLRFSNQFLKFTILPISYRSVHNNMTIQKVIISSCSNSGEEENELTTVSNIRLYTKPKEFKSYVVRNAASASTNSGVSGTNSNSIPAGNSPSSTVYPREIRLTSSLILAIPDIVISIDMKLLRRLLSEVKDFAECFSSLPSGVNSVENSFKSQNSMPSSTSSRSQPSNVSVLQNSVYASQRISRRLPSSTSSASKSSTATVSNSARMTSMVSFHLAINSIRMRITDVFPKFGAFAITFDKLSLDLLRNGNLQGSVLSVTMQRELDKQIDKFVYEFTGENRKQISNYPLVVFNLKRSDKVSTLEFSIWNFMIEYYTVWLQLVENEVHESPPVEAVLDVLPDQGSPKDSGISVKDSGVNQNRKFDVKFNLYDCSIGLSPGRLQCKGILAVERCTADLTFGEHQLYIKSSLRNISLLLIDNIGNLRDLTVDSKRNISSLPHNYNTPHTWFLELGCLNFGSINATHVGVTLNSNLDAIRSRNKRLGIKERLSLLELKINSDEHVLNLCADSSHTLIQMINDLKQPIVFSDEEKFKVQLKEDINLLDNTDNIFDYNGKNLDSDFSEVSKNSPLQVVDEYIDNSDISTLEQDMSSLSFNSTIKEVNSNLNSFDEDHFAVNAIGKNNDEVVIPIIMYINASKVHINLFDGYDWKATRDEIKGAVKRVETQAIKELKSRPTKAKVKFEDDIGKKKVKTDTRDLDYEDEDEGIEYDSDLPLIGETLYQSIHLSIPTGTNPSRLTQNINKNVQSERNERNIAPEDELDSNLDHKSLKLHRSKYHKLVIELKNLEVGVSIFTTRDPRNDDPSKIDYSKVPEFEIVNSIDLKIENFQILDNVPTSTWHKFIGYLRTAGDRELSTKSLRLQLKNIRPNYSLCATEAIIDIALLPLRLYIDQDTLDFVTRFCEFKDARFQLPIDDILYIQKFKISPLRIKLDYKPKKVDYAGIRSGHTSEFINFFILDGADILLKSVTLYGLLGFPKLGIELKNVWAPDVQATQLSGVLAGLAPLRSIVNIGNGVKDLVAIPVKEYKKDGRLMRSLQKGAFSFAKTTSSELLKLGVKLAAGTQVLLESGEEAFGGEGSSARLPKKTASFRNRIHRNVAKGDIDSEGDDIGDEDDDELGDMFYVDGIGAKIGNNDDEIDYVIANSKSFHNDLMASSQLLNQSLQGDHDKHGSNQYGVNSRKLYSFADIDDSHTIDNKLLRRNPGFNVKPKREKEKAAANSSSTASGNGNSAEDDESQKAISLYSNQPTGAQEGLQLAYTSIGRNLKSAKVAVIRTRDAMIDAESVPEAAIAMAKGAPVILIRPMIGATEAVSKTLLGISNQIDPESKRESEEKYKPL